MPDSRSARIRRLNLEQSHQLLEKVLDHEPSLIFDILRATPDLPAATEPALQPAAEPAVEPAAEPAQEPAVEPAAESAQEPAVELEAEPAPEPPPHPLPPAWCVCRNCRNMPTL